MLAWARSLMKRDCGSSFASLRPGRDQVVVERRAAGGAAVRGLPFHELHRLRNGEQVPFADGLAHLAVRVIGAAAHRLVLRFGGRVGATDGRGEDLLDQAGAGAAGRGCLGVLAHVVQREQALRLDRLDDGRPCTRRCSRRPRASSAMVAALRLAGMADVADVVLAEHQVVADFVDVLAVLEQLEVPGAVGRVAVEHGADQVVVLDHQLLVHAAGRGR